MKRRMISLSLSIIMMLQLLPVGVFATDSVSAQDTSAGEPEYQLQMEPTDTEYSLIGQLYIPNIDGKPEPATDKSEPVSIDVEAKYTGISAEFYFAGKEPDEIGTYRYLWLYSTVYPKDISLDCMTPIGVNEVQWSYDREKYQSVSNLFFGNYGQWSYDSAFHAMPISEITGEKESEVDMLYLACLCAYVDSKKTSILASGYNAGSVVRVSYAPAAPITGISTKIVHWPAGEPAPVSAEGEHFDIENNKYNSGIYSLIYDSNNKEINYNVKYL